MKNQKTVFALKTLFMNGSQCVLTINVPVFYMALGLNDFDAGISITEAQMALASLVAISGPKKVSTHTALSAEQFRKATAICKIA
jgi:hypothetical protein